jgi:hypothetical protein
MADKTTKKMNEKIGNNKDCLIFRLFNTTEFLSFPITITHNKIEIALGIRSAELIPAKYINCPTTK